MRETESYDQLTLANNMTKSRMKGDSFSSKELCDDQIQPSRLQDEPSMPY